MRNAVKALLMVFVSAAPSLILLVAAAGYGVWWRVTTPAWHQGPLTPEVLAHPLVQAADQDCRAKAGGGLMELQTFFPWNRYTTLSEVRWTNGDVGIVLSGGPPIPVDAQGIQAYPRRWIPPLGLPLGVLVPGDFVMWMFLNRNGTMVLTDPIVLPHSAILSHKKDARVAGVSTYTIGALNQGSLAPPTPEPPPKRQGPRIPGRLEGLEAHGPFL